LCFDNSCYSFLSSITSNKRTFFWNCRTRGSYSNIFWFASLISYLYFSYFNASSCSSIFLFSNSIFSNRSYRSFYLFCVSDNNESGQFSILFKDISCNLFFFVSLLNKILLVLFVYFLFFKLLIYFYFTIFATHWPWL